MTLFIKIVFWLLLLIIYSIATLPNYNDLPEVASVSDLANHFVAFFVLTGMLYFAYRWALIKIASFLVGYGFFIEITQYFLPTRSFDLLDILADSVGIAVAIFIIMKSR